jgi:hypothetical protein
VTPAAARQLVVASMLVTGAVVAYDLVNGELKSQTKGGNGDLAFRSVWSLALLFLLLALLADTVPGIAGPFAGLVALAVLVGRGASVRQIATVIPAKGGTH